MKNSTGFLESDKNRKPSLPHHCNSTTTSVKTDFELGKRFVVKEEVYKLEINTDAFDVASYILKKMGEMTTMKMHKLLYYSQAWSLVWDEKPLFQNEIEAWSNGPVVKDVFTYHRGHFTVNSDTFFLGNRNLLNQKQKETVDSVLEFYGDKSSQWLIELTHIETPWKDARKGLSPNDRGNTVISLESMAMYYSSL